MRKHYCSELDGISFSFFFVLKHNIEMNLAIRWFREEFLFTVGELCENHYCLGFVLRESVNTVKASG